jgi:tetraacyldisaccharide 4'-kinase
MQAPKFWGNPKSSVASILLRPAACLYNLAATLRQKLASPWEAPIPVICVGNLVAGGAGKTPVVLKILEMLKQRGNSPHALSRGYGGNLTGPIQVDPEHHTYIETGDEPLLLASHAPTWVSIDRVQGAQAAREANVIVMDDGFQNPSLFKNLSLVVVDGRYGFGNGQIIPAGPLRESIKDGLGRADAIVLIGDDDTTVEKTIRHYCEKKLPILRATLLAGPDARELKGQAVFAFAGIGDPRKFFKTLEETGCTLVEQISFADHHPYSTSEINALKEAAEKKNAILITTEKDAIRLPNSTRDGIKILTIDLKWNDEAAVHTLLDQLNLNGG